MKPKAEGLLNIEGIAFDLRPVNVEPVAVAGGLVSSVSGNILTTVFTSNNLYLTLIRVFYK